MKLRLLVSAISFAGLVLGFQNCSQVSFSEKAELASESTPQEPQITEATQAFTSSSKKTPIDMVWVIDNSGSMSQNVARVRENFAAFAATLKGEVDIKFALISRADAQGYNTSIRLSDYTSLGTQIPFMVHSFNPMLVLAAATCAAVVDPADLFCAAVKANSRYNKAYGSLNSFFRDGSQKVFVFVTDDDSRATAGGTSLQFDALSGGGVESVNVSSLVENVDYITAQTFASRMTNAFGSASAFKTFGFVAQSAKLSPCYARESTNYQSLIASSGGGSFNICDKDWSSNFKTLTSSVISYAASTYTVSDIKFTGIESVKLNGMTLKLGSDYSVNKNVVTLNSSLFVSIGNYDVDVIYTRQE